MLALLLLSLLARAEAVVIIGADVDAESVSVESLRRLCLGESSTLPGNEPVRLILPQDSSPPMETLLTDWVKMSASTFARHWLRLTMSGRGVPPEQLSSTAAIRYVASHPGAIAIIEPQEVPDGVRVIPITR